MVKTVILPRLVRFRDAPSYLGMDRHRFNSEVRPRLTEIPIGSQGIAFDRLDLDAWVDDYKRRSGRPAAYNYEGMIWDERERQAFTSVKATGTLIKKYSDADFAKARALVNSKKRKGIARRLEEVRQANVYGVRPERTFRLVVCNDVAASVIESVRGKRSAYVFAYEDDSPMFQMNTGAWQRARKRAGLEHVCVHDLKHTFGRRLRAAGVSFEDRQDLLGHRSARITTHYSHAELENLYLAANKVCYSGQDGIVMSLLRPAKSRRGRANNLEPASFCGVH
nr:hypothetical protein 1 [Coxiellaceae bacterium]